MYMILFFFFSFTRVALLMMVLHYIVESVFHLARLVYFADKLDIANHCFMVFNVLFVLVRLGTITLAVLTFW
jgi:translocating chain-associated membrane protein 1